MTSPIATPLSFLGIALEPFSAKGTPISAPTAYIPVNPSLDNFDNLVYLDDQALRGSMALTYNKIPGVKHGELNFDADVFPDTIGWQLAGVLGDVSYNNARVVTDAVTNTDTSLVSATAAFTAADVGAAVYGQDIFAGTTIVSVTNATTVVLSHVTTGTHTGRKVAFSGRQVTDAVTNSTTTVTSATAAFTAYDVNRPVTGTDIPANTYIASVTNGTTIVLSQAATGSHSGNTLTIGAGAPFTTLISLYNGRTNQGQPPSYTLTDYYGLTSNSYQYGGSQFNDITFNFNADGMLTHATKAMAFPGALGAIPSPSFTTVTPHAAWEGTTTIGGVVVGTMETGTFQITRPVTPINTVNGAQPPVAVWLGRADALGKMTFIADGAATEYLRYLNNTQPSLDINFTHGAGPAYVAVGLHSSQIAYVNPTKPAVRGKDYVNVDVSWSAIANTSDVGPSSGWSPCKMTLVNAVAPGTYA